MEPLPSESSAFSSASSTTSTSPRRRVHFATNCQVKLIEIAKKAYTKQEMRATYYTKQDMKRWRKMAESLAEDLSFYSCEELWDRFGVRSKTEQKIRRQIRWATCKAVQCFNEEKQGLPELIADSEHSDDDDGSASSSCNGDSYNSLDEYFKISDACAVVAKARAMRIQEQVYRANGIARLF
jgi:hypothetical protein